jgi:hypothetical protein
MIILDEAPVLRQASNVGPKDNKKFCGGPGGSFSKAPPGRRRHRQLKIDTTLVDDRRQRNIAREAVSEKTGISVKVLQVYRVKQILER